MNEITDLLSFFKGQWLIERSVYIKSTNQVHATATGRAQFMILPEHSSMFYEERGILRMESNNSPLSFSRSFRYLFIDDTLEVYFADGPDNGSLYQQYSYQQKNSKLLPSQIHICGKDAYKGEYLLTGSSSFTLITTIDGTSKDFLITTNYIRDSK